MSFQPEGKAGPRQPVPVAAHFQPEVSVSQRNDRCSDLRTSNHVPDSIIALDRVAFSTRRFSGSSTTPSRHHCIVTAGVILENSADRRTPRRRCSASIAAPPATYGKSIISTTAGGEVVNQPGIPPVRHLLPQGDSVCPALVIESKERSLSALRRPYTKPRQASPEAERRVLSAWPRPVKGHR